MLFVAGERDVRSDKKETLLGSAKQRHCKFNEKVNTDYPHKAFDTRLMR